MTRLTDRSCRNLKPAATRREFSDGGGLYFIIQPSGFKSWALRYRRPLDSRPAKLTLGPFNPNDEELSHPPVIGAPLTVAAARKLAADEMLKRAMGIDPAAEWKIQRLQTIISNRSGGGLLSVRQRTWGSLDDRRKAWVVDHTDAMGVRRLRTFRRKEQAYEHAAAIVQGSPDTERRRRRKTIAPRIDIPCVVVNGVTYRRAATRSRQQESGHGRR